MSIKNYIHHVHSLPADNTVLDCPNISYKYNADTYDINKLCIIMISSILFIVSILLIIISKNSIVQMISSAILGGVLSAVVWLITIWHNDKTNAELSLIEHRICIVDKLLNSINTVTNLINPITLEIQPCDDENFDLRLIKLVQMVENIRTKTEIDSSKLKLKWFDNDEYSIEEFIDLFQKRMITHEMIENNEKNFNVVRWNEHTLGTELNVLKDKLVRYRLYVLCGDAPVTKKDLDRRIKLKTFFEKTSRKNYND